MLVSVNTANELKLKSEDVVEIEFQGRKVKGAIWVQPGHPDNSVTVFLGYGRTKAGRVGNGRWLQRVQTAHRNRRGRCRAKLTKTGESYRLGIHAGSSEYGRPRAGSRRDAGRLHQEPGFAHEMVEAPPPRSDAV